MGHCDQCGSRVDQPARFCRNCGAAAEAADGLWIEFRDQGEQHAQPGSEISVPMVIANDGADALAYSWRVDAPDADFDARWCRLDMPSTLGGFSRRDAELLVAVPASASDGAAYHLRLVVDAPSPPARAEADCVLVVDRTRRACANFLAAPKLVLNDDQTLTATLKLLNCGSTNVSLSFDVRHEDGWHFDVVEPRLTLRSGVGPVTVTQTLRPPDDTHPKARDEVKIQVKCGSLVLAETQTTIERAAAAPPAPAPSPPPSPSPSRWRRRFATATVSALPLLLFLVSAVLPGHKPISVATPSTTLPAPTTPPPTPPPTPRSPETTVPPPTIRPTVPSTHPPTTLDRTPPAVPGKLAVTRDSPNHVGLLWAPSTDDVGVAGYTVYRDGQALTTIKGATTRSADTTVKACESHDYSVDAFDTAGNHSAQTPRVPPSDTIPPSAPTQASVVIAASTGGANVTWAAAADNFCVDHYEVWRDGAVAGRTATLSYLDPVPKQPGGYNCSQTWKYLVYAVDPAGNRSNPSTEVALTWPCATLG